MFFEAGSGGWEEGMNTTLGDRSIWHTRDLIPLLLPSLPEFDIIRGVLCSFIKNALLVMKVGYNSKWSSKFNLFPSLAFKHFPSGANTYGSIKKKIPVLQISIQNTQIIQETVENLYENKWNIYTYIF